MKKSVSKEFDAIRDDYLNVFTALRDGTMPPSEVKTASKPIDRKLSKLKKRLKV